MENPTFRERGFTKNQYRGGGFPKKKGTWRVFCFKGGLGKKEEGSVFEEGVDTLMHTMYQ